MLFGTGIPYRRVVLCLWMTGVLSEPYLRRVGSHRAELAFPIAVLSFVFG